MNRATAKEIILNRLQEEKTSVVTTKELLELTGLDLRMLKITINDLRVDYPICLRETYGGGYWIARSADDILDFTGWLRGRIKRSANMINIMSNHLSKFYQK